MTGQSSRYFTLINLNSPTAYDEIAEALTELGLSPDSADDNGVTMLLCAMRRRNFKLAELLLNEGANPFIISKYGQCAAGLIARIGDNKLKKSLTDWGPSWQSFTSEGEAWPVVQGLCRDAALGSIAGIQAKLQSGASPNERDAWGHTALLLAIIHGHQGAVEALYRAGANPYAKQTLTELSIPRFLEAVKPLQDEAISKFIDPASQEISWPPSVIQAGDSDITPDTLRSISSAHHLVRRGDLNRLERLVKMGVSPSLKNSHGLTITDIAEQTRQSHIAQWIKELEANQTGVDWPFEQKPAQDPARKEDAPDHKVQPPAQKTATDAEEVVFKSEADLNARALIEEGDIPGLQILLARGMSPDALMGNKASLLTHACRTNDESFLFLLLNGASPTLSDKNGATAAELAASDPTKSFLIKQYAAAEAKRKKYLTSPRRLVDAVTNKKMVETASLAFSNRRFVNATIKGGQTLLGIAAQHGDLRLCEILLDLGADPWKPCEDGLLPVQIAHHELVQDFLARRMRLMKAWSHLADMQLIVPWLASARAASESGSNLVDADKPHEGTLNAEATPDEEYDDGFLLLPPDDFDAPEQQSKAVISPIVAGKLDDEIELSLNVDEESENSNMPMLASKEKEGAVVPPSAASLSESLRGLGYSLGDAVADLIDNSIAAMARQVWLNYSLDSDRGIWLSVRDNGCGMTELELQNAMKLGSRSPKELRAKTDLGRFGLGLKTASFSQCRRLVVCSKKAGKTSAFAWDLDTLAREDKWVLERIDSPLSDERLSALEAQESGTIVLWEKIDRAFVSNEAAAEFESVQLDALDRLRKHLSLTFHLYLAPDFASGEPELEIYFGPRETRVAPWDPFLSSSFASPCRYQEEYWTNGGKEPLVSIRPYVLPDPLATGESITLYGEKDLLDMQGFFIYRGKRLICCAGWLNLNIPKTTKNALARIKITFSNEHDLDWQLDVRKSQVKIPRRKGWNALRQLLYRRANAAAEKSAEVLGASLEQNHEAEKPEISTMWRKVHGEAPQIDFSSALGQAFAKAFKNAETQDAVRGLLELVAFSHPSRSGRAQLSIASPLARAAIVDLVYEMADRCTDKVPLALKQLAQYEPFCYWPAILEEFKEYE